MERIDLVRRVAIGDIIRRNARRYPDKIAMVDEKGQKFTYAELNSEVNKCAHALHNLGLKKGDRVAAAAANSGQLIILIYGVAKAGLTLTTMNPNLSEEIILNTLKHSESKMLVIDDVYSYKFTFKTDVEHRIKFGISGEDVPGFMDFSDFIADGCDDEFEKVEIWERDISKLLYTSGTTAEPKGAMISHLAEFVSSLNNIVDLDLRVEDVNAILTPLFHCSALTLTNSTFHVGATGVIFRKFEPQQFLQRIQDEKFIADDVSGVAGSSKLEGI